MEQQEGPGNRPGDLDELVAGADPRGAGVGPLRARWDRLPTATRSLATAVLGVVVGALIVLAVQGTRAPGRQPSKPSVLEPTLPASTTLLAQDVCTSYQGEILQVSFRVTNAGQSPVDVVAIRPDLPLGMLLALRTDLDGGTCGTGPAGPADGTLQPGQSQPVTFRLLPLVQCAQPAPVAAAVDLANASPATVSIPVLVDLGSVDFPGCTTPTAIP